MSQPSPDRLEHEPAMRYHAVGNENTTQLVPAGDSTEINYYVYMLKCADGTLYTGITTDLERRVRVHNDGKGAKYTRSRTPVELVYSEPLKSKSEALKREWQIKKLSRSDKLALCFSERVRDCSDTKTEDPGRV